MKFIKLITIHLFIFLLVIGLVKTSNAITKDDLPATYKGVNSAYRNKDWIAGINNLEEILKVTPADKNAIYNLALFYLRNNQLAEVMPTLQRLGNYNRLDEKLQPSVLRLYYETGIAYFVSSKFDSSSIYLKKVTVLDKEHFGSQYYLALSYFAQGKLDACDYRLEQAEKISPKSRLVKLRYSDLYLYRGQKALDSDAYNIALENFRLALTLHPTSELHYYIALSYHYIGDNNKAFDYIEKRLGLFRKNKDLFENKIKPLLLEIGNSLMRCGEYEQAKNVYNFILTKVDKENVLAHLQTSILLSSIGEFEEAIKEWEIAQNLDQSLPAEDLQNLKQHSAEYYLNIGKYYLKREQYPLATEQFQSVLVFSPNDTKAAEYLQKIEIRKNKIMMLLEFARKDITSAKQDNIAIAYLSTIEHLEDAQKLDPYNNEINKELKNVSDKIVKIVDEYYKKGKAFLEKNEYLKAKEHLDIAYQLEPGHSGVETEIPRLNAAISVYVKVLFNKAQDSIEIEDLRSALVILADARKLSPENEDVIMLYRETEINRLKLVDKYYYQGFRKMKRSDLEGAKELFTSVLNLDPNHENTLYNMTVVEQRMRARKGTSDEIRLLYYKGVELYLIGEYQKSIAKWKEVLELDPMNVEAAEGIADSEAKLGIR